MPKIHKEQLVENFVKGTRTTHPIRPTPGYSMGFKEDPNTLLKSQDHNKR